jgi:lipopolysaccharide/colanic/teichoic acid biosynthesis glycosyltransferase
MGASSRVIRVVAIPEIEWGVAVKRAFDIIAATTGLLLLSPLIILVSLAIKVDSREPVFCRPKYYDLNDRVFAAFEFRCPTSKPGRTGIGQVLCRSGLDKVPQLVSVLRGDMSVVGPEPFTAALGAIYRERMGRERLPNVRPGLISWAQVRKARNDGKFLHRVESDFYYLANRSFLFDMKILALAVLLEANKDK